MKRGMVGGAYRGPVGVGRQRRAIRTVQVILVLLGAVLLVMAYRAFTANPVEPDVLGPESRSRTGEGVVLVVLALGAFGGAAGLQAGNGVRLLTPVKLREMESTGSEPIKLETDDEAGESEVRSTTG